MIKIIDANTGAQLIPGVEFKNIKGTIETINVSKNFFDPWAIVRINGEFIKLLPPYLKYRFLHPEFMFKPMWFWNT